MAYVSEIFDRSIPEPNSGCWIWMGALTPAGYGQFYDSEKKKVVFSHRASYENVYGSIPSGLHIDHKCRVRCCCNPDHLQAVTCRTNILLGEGVSAVNAKKKFCSKGHELTPDNIFSVPRNPNARRCRICNLLDNRKWRERQPKRLRSDSYILNDEQIREIKSLSVSGLSQRKIASRYEITQSYVSRIVSGNRRGQTND